MKAELITATRQEISENAFVELVIWAVPAPVHGSVHGFKYRLAYVVEGECVLRYDNEAGKGDHRHTAKTECRYAFISLAQLLDDFFDDVQNWRSE